MRDEMRKLRIGISACLLGEKVRYDGGHKRDRFLTDVLGQYADWVRVCPELELGLGVPRPTLRLEDRDGEVCMIMPKTGEDYSARMRRFGETRAKALAKLKLDGYVLKSKSPSCGMERVKIWRPTGGSPAANGRGLFAQALMTQLPHLPVEEEGRLNDPRLRENFVSRLYAHQRWQTPGEVVSRKTLTDFHAAHKYQLMAHNQAGMRRAGRLLANPDAFDSIDDLAQAYHAEFTSIMSRVPTTRNHTNALQHMAGYVTKHLDVADTAELIDSIDKYRAELLPLIVPITLLRHYVRKFDVSYLQNQVYLFPHPHELMLLNRL
jgi:uncharacterized protein YbgA (DUF1722 family)/uncharacterized protein YbbK (DUF523 family)